MFASGEVLSIFTLIVFMLSSLPALSIERNLIVVDLSMVIGPLYVWMVAPLLRLYSVVSRPDPLVSSIGLSVKTTSDRYQVFWPAVP